MRILVTADLLESYRQHLQEHHLELTVRWMDGAYVRLPMSEEVFVGMLAEKLSKQIAELAQHVEKIAVFMHHLPFRQLVPANRPSRFAFAAAYMGAEILGKVLLACPKVTHVYCGHSHWPRQCQIGHIKVVNIGSTYIEKKLKIPKL